MAKPGWSDVGDAGLRLLLVTAALLIVFGGVYLHEVAVSEAGTRRPRPRRRCSPWVA